MKRFSWMTLTSFLVLTMSQATPILALEPSSSLSSDTSQTSTSVSSALEPLPSTSSNEPASSSTEPNSTNTSNSSTTATEEPQTSSTNSSTSTTISSSTTSSTTDTSSTTTTSSTATIASSTISSSEVDEAATLSSTALYRLYNPGLQSHLYTKDTNEYKVLATQGWTQEGQAWYTSLNQGQPVYRLYNPGLRVHLYTKDTNEYKVLATKGWTQEGEAFRSYGSVPIYRLYNEGLKKHLYTKDANEYKVLATKGWKQEGQAFLALDKATTSQTTAPKAAAIKAPTGKLTIENTNDLAGTFDIRVSQVSAPSTIQTIQLAVWSDTNGQDDLTWYTPTKQTDGTYKVAIAKKNHKQGIGTYQARLYYTIDQKQTLIASQSTTLRLVPLSTNFTFSTQLTTQNEVVLTVRNLDSRITTVNIPVWSDTNGQDDLIWYSAKKVAAGQFTVTIPLKKHYFATGLYNSHIYATSDDGLQATKAETFTVNQLPQAVTAATVKTQNVQTNLGRLDIAVTEHASTKQITGIRIAVWSTTDQSNLYWYTLSPTGTTTTVPVHISLHKYLSGSYTIHTYVDYADKTTDFYNLGAITLKSPYTGSIDAVLKLASSLTGVRGGTPIHAQLISDYNSILPRPVGYAVKVSDDWCDIFVTVIFQRAGLSHLIGRECGVERHIQIFKAMGIWNENGASTPQSGDLITFNWDATSQPNDAFAHHIGIVERVENGRIYTIEGNSLNEVRHRSYAIGDANIRGFARPRY